MEVAKELLQVLNSLDESTQFCTSGSLSPALPGLEVNRVGAVGLPITAAKARELIAQASQAPYGRGEDTIVDTKVRSVWQIEPSQFSLLNPEWDSFLAGIVKIIKKEFAIDKQVKCDLYKLLIYEKGDFFAPHRDSEKVKGMFATLVVCLPCGHKGGTLIVEHDGQRREIDFGGPQADYKIQYAAFYTDCRHELKPVTEGYRVCLVYNLALAQRKRQPLAPRNSEKVATLAALLEKLFADEARNKIAIPLRHEYTQAGLDLDSLKGVDRSRVEVLRRATEQLGYHCYLSLLTFYQSGDVDYDTLDYDSSGWGRGYEVDESTADMGEIYEEELTLDYWIDAQGQKKEFGKMQLDKEEVLSDTDFQDFDVEQSVTEATGNEGVTMERWYRQGVIVIWPADRYFRIFAKEGQDSAIPALEDLLARAKNSSSIEECRAFAKEIIGTWKPPAYVTQRDASKSPQMLKLLEKIGDPALVDRFISNVLPKDYAGTEGGILSTLSHRFGWGTVAEALTRFVSLQSPGTQTASLAATVSIFEDLCCSPVAMTPERKAACKAIALELERTVSKWDSHKEDTTWLRPREGRQGIIESLTRALCAIDDTDLLGRFLSHAFADEEHYGLHAVLIPAVHKIQQWIDREPKASDYYDQLLNHCIEELQALTATAVEAPADWRQEITIKCQCADCKELQQFLRSPQERIHRFAVRKERRQHLHQQIQSHGCDVDHVTERKGSPQTLVCTKNRASYERKKQQFATNKQLLAELHGLERTASKTRG